jgi:DNA repair protein RecO (recombination protein O)
VLGPGARPRLRRAIIVPAWFFMFDRIFLRRTGIHFGGKCSRTCAMEWTDEGIVLGVRRHGESNAVLEVLTKGHGRHLGLVRGGAGSRLRPVLQPGNSVRVTWRARLDEHLGVYAVEGLRLRTADLLGEAYAVFGVTHLAALCRLLPERDPHLVAHDMLEAILDHLADPVLTAALTARFELQMLVELGFGLDLDECAATGVRADLDYVSPKSGRAVSRDAGAPWRNRLLRLPTFLREEIAVETPGAEDISDALTLTGYFLVHRVLEPRGLPSSEARGKFIAAALGRATVAP